MVSIYRQDTSFICSIDYLFSIVKPLNNYLYILLNDRFHNITFKTIEFDLNNVYDEVSTSSSHNKIEKAFSIRKNAFVILNCSLR